MIFKYNELLIYYEILGTNKIEIPVLFLHGWEGSCTSFSYFAKELSNFRTCINLDFPPFGNSSNLTQPLTVKDYADIVLKLLEHLNINKVDVVAHSFGGRVAIELSSATNVVNKQLLTGCAGLCNKNFKKFIKVKKYKILKFLSKIRLYSKEKLSKFGSPEYIKLNNIMKKTFVNIVNYNQEKLIKNIKVPTLLVWGTKDKETPFYFTKVFKKNIKDCEVIKFKNRSHFAYLEEPYMFLKILISYFT